MRTYFEDEEDGKAFISFCQILSHVIEETANFKGEAKVNFNMEKITFQALSPEECFKETEEIGLDANWKIKSKKFGKIMKGKGIYIIRTPSETIYVGKTRGPTMDFHTRLYRHATEPASQSSKVYKTLKKLDNKVPILVSLLTKDKIKSLFENELDSALMIDLYEQFLIHKLKPRIQKENQEI